MIEVKKKERETSESLIDKLQQQKHNHGELKGQKVFTPLVALSDKEITINGSGSLTTRPMDFFDEILPLLGVKIKSNEGIYSEEYKEALTEFRAEYLHMLEAEYNEKDCPICINKVPEEGIIIRTLKHPSKFEALKLKSKRFLKIGLFIIIFIKYSLHSRII